MSHSECSRSAVGPLSEAACNANSCGIKHYRNYDMLL